jgi:2-C-methyl-D-erythritol 4-phosphate cytidylyltransferase
MKNASMDLCVVVAITSPTAFLEIERVPSLIRSIQGILSFWSTAPITVAVTAANEPVAREILRVHGMSYELLPCDANVPKTLAAALMCTVRNCGAFLVHDASRPLIRLELLARILRAFENGVDAVRPSIAFTETLKVVGTNSVIGETLDRTQVRRISTPEVIRTSAVDLESENTGWFVPLKKGANTKYVEGDPESLRINSMAERDLLESFLHWKETDA